MSSKITKAAAVLALAAAGMPQAWAQGRPHVQPKLGSITHTGVADGMVEITVSGSFSDSPPVPKIPKITCNGKPLDGAVASDGAPSGTEFKFKMPQTDAPSCVLLVTEAFPRFVPEAERTSSNSIAIDTTKLPEVPADSIPQATAADGNKQDYDARGLPIVHTVVNVNADMIYATAFTHPDYMNSIPRTIVSSLTKKDVQLWAEDRGGGKVPLNIDVFSTEQKPVTLGIVLDASTSMLVGASGSDSVSKRDAGELAAKQILSYLSTLDYRAREKSNAFVLNFNDQFYLNSGAATANAADRFSTDHAALESWISRKAPGLPDGKIPFSNDTKMNEAMMRALGVFQAGSELAEDPAITARKTAIGMKAQSEGRSTLTPAEDAEIKRLDALAQKNAPVRSRKIIFLITDGEDEAVTPSISDVIEAAVNQQTMVFVVGFASPNSPEGNNLRALAQQTGGDALMIGSTNELGRDGGKVAAFAQQVIDRLSNQYVIGYSNVLKGCYKLKGEGRDSGILESEWREKKEKKDEKGKSFDTLEEYMAKHAKDAPKFDLEMKRTVGNCKKEDLSALFSKY